MHLSGSCLGESRDVVERDIDVDAVLALGHDVGGFAGLRLR